MIKDFFTANKKPILIFAIVFFAEFLVILILIQINGIGIFFRGDGRDYQNLANNLIYHQTLAITPEPPYLPTNFRVPIYPFWLAFIYLIFQSYNAAVFVGALVFAISAPLVYLIGREIFTEKIALIAALLSGLEPWAFFQSGFLTAEQIFMPIFLLSIYFFCRYLKSGTTLQLCLASLILGIAALTRPAALFFVAIFIFLAFIFELRHSIWQSLRASALIFLIFIAVLAPWLIRNKIVLGSWQFSSASGLTIFYDYIMLEQYLGKTKPGEVVDWYERARQLLGTKSDRDTMSVENSKKMSRIALGGIKSNFGSFLKMYSQNILLFFFKNSYGNIFFDLKISGANIQSDIGRNLSNKDFAGLLALIKDASIGSKILIVLAFFWPLIVVLAIIGIFAKFKADPRNLIFCFLIFWIAYFLVLVGGLWDISRYKLVVNAPLFMLAVFGFYRIYNYFSRAENF